MSSFLDFVKDSAKAAYRFLTHRILWLFIVTAAAFYILAAQLFQLQIVKHDTFRVAQPKTETVTVPIAPLRGTIYDAKGRPLAINRATRAVKIDPSYSISNAALYELVKIFEKNGEEYADEFPITKEEPYAFTYPDNDWREWYEFRWKDDMTVYDEKTKLTAENATATQAFEFLIKQFKIDEELPGLPNSEIRKILNFRCMLYMKRMIVMEDYNPTPITLATDVSDATVAAIEENNDIFSAVYIETETLREYPEGIYFSHMLGYVREISEEELAENKDQGYSNTDLIGKAGLERSMEKYLRGESGSQTFEINSAGRRLGTPTEVVEPQAGGKIFLTVDAELTKKAYHLLESSLAQALVNKITLKSTREPAITLKEIFSSFIESNNLPIKEILEAKEGTGAFGLRGYITDRFPEANASEKESLEEIKAVLVEGIDTGRIHPADILLTLIDTGILTDPDGEISARLKSNPNNAQAITIEKMLALELTPQMINLDPCTGSVVIVDTQNGDVLTAVGYPSYDNNRLVNIWDNDYYIKTHVDDPTDPENNRPFREARAPGSTLKMITAAAALETGVITDTTRIYDESIFTKASEPATKCSIYPGSHGSINVRQALAVSCNYFFCEASYRLGNAKNGNTYDGIAILNDYMEYFGLNEKTGVEIGEYFNYFDGEAYSGLDLKISSPEFKKFTELQADPFTPEYNWAWQDGDTVRTAMGQALNNYTPAMMARYISVIANRGVRYPLHLVQTVEDGAGNIAMQYEAKPDRLNLSVSDKTWDIITDGMKLVTEGSSGGVTGTAVADFKDFPIHVAGKTGTAEQISTRRDHSSFASFAPFDDPQIAVYVSVPFGDTRAYTHIAARIAREMIGEALGLNNVPELPEKVNTLTR